VHVETTMSGSCSGSTNSDLTAQTQQWTCKPQGVTVDKGGGFYGTWDDTTNSFNFACSVDNTMLSPFRVPGKLSVTGQVFVAPST
jgi:hypothetical protein